MDAILFADNKNERRIYEYRYAAPGDMAETKAGRDFTESEVAQMKKVLENADVADQVDHCLYQLARFARDAAVGRAFNALQFGYNMGRAQELLQPGATTETAGRDCRRRRFEPLVEKKEYGEAVDLTLVIGFRLLDSPKSLVWMKETLEARHADILARSLAKWWADVGSV